MKLCIPVLENTGLQAKLEPHFPNASTLLVFDTASRQHHYIDANATDAIPVEQTIIDAVLCGSINRHTLRSLLDQGIQIFGTAAQTVIEAITQFENGELETVVSSGHGAHGGCGCHSESAGTAEHPCGTGQGQGQGHADKDHECCGGHGHADADHECCGGHGKGTCQSHGAH